MLGSHGYHAIAERCVPVNTGAAATTTVPESRTTPGMTQLYHRLSGVGLTRPYVKTLALPDWWNDQIANTPSGYAEALMHLSRHLGLSLKSLQDPSQPVALRDFGVCKFKKTTGTSDDELGLARALGTRAAQLAATAMRNPFKGVPTSSLELRLSILDRGEPWVGLEQLLKYCWRIGIPVVFLARFPPNAKKMHGMTAMFNGRPVIVLSKAHRRTAWLLFVLAHELGHIAGGHLADGQALIDEDVEKNEADAEEEQANAFALGVICGDSDFRVLAKDRWLNAAELAQEAKRVGGLRRIDPGHVVLNYAHSMGDAFWPVANAALKKIEPHGNAPATVRKALAEELDWSALPSDSCEFLMRVTRTES